MDGDEEPGVMVDGDKLGDSLQQCAFDEEMANHRFHASPELLTTMKYAQARIDNNEKELREIRGLVVACSKAAQTYASSMRQLSNALRKASESTVADNAVLASNNVESVATIATEANHLLTALNQAAQAVSSSDGPGGVVSVIAGGSVKGAKSLVRSSEARARRSVATALNSCLPQLDATIADFGESKRRIADFNAAYANYYDVVLPQCWAVNRHNIDDCFNADRKQLVAKTEFIERNIQADLEITKRNSRYAPTILKQIALVYEAITNGTVRQATLIADIPVTANEDPTGSPFVGSPFSRPLTFEFDTFYSEYAEDLLNRVGTAEKWPKPVQRRHQHSYEMLNELSTLSERPPQLYSKDAATVAKRARILCPPNEPPKNGRPARRGYMNRMTATGRRRWVRRWVELKDSKLVYHTPDTNTPVKEVAPLIHMTKARPNTEDTERRWCFELIQPSAAPSMWQAESEADLNAWLTTFDRATEVAMNDLGSTPTADKSKGFPVDQPARMSVEEPAGFVSITGESSSSRSHSRNNSLDLLSDRKNKIAKAISNYKDNNKDNRLTVGQAPPIGRPSRKTVESSRQARLILRVRGNDVCADCGRDGTKSESLTWCAVNLGVVFCIECSGVHRGLSVSCSKVRSVVLDSFQHEMTMTMRCLGNFRVNRFLEGALPHKEVVSDPLKLKEFITNKYRDKTFVVPLSTLLTDKVKQWCVMPAWSTKDAVEQLKQVNGDTLFFECSEYPIAKSDLGVARGANCSDPLDTENIHLNIYHRLIDISYLSADSLLVEAVRVYNVPVMIYALQLMALPSALVTLPFGSPTPLGDGKSGQNYIVTTTALHVAAFGGSVAVMETLLNYIRTFDAAGDQAMTLANGTATDPTSVRRVSDLDVTDGTQRTPLWLATQYNCTAAALMLLLRGADPRLADASNSSPRDLLRRRENPDPDFVTALALVECELSNFTGMSHDAVTSRMLAGGPMRDQRTGQTTDAHDVVRQHLNNVLDKHVATLISS